MCRNTNVLRSSIRVATKKAAEDSDWERLKLTVKALCSCTLKCEGDVGNDLVLLGRVVDPDALTEEQVRTLSADLYREVVITNFDLNREVAITNFGWNFWGSRNLTQIKKIRQLKKRGVEWLYNQNFGQYITHPN